MDPGKLSSNNGRASLRNLALATNKRHHHLLPHRQPATSSPLETVPAHSTRYTDTACNQSTYFLTTLAIDRRKSLLCHSVFAHSISWENSGTLRQPIIWIVAECVHITQRRLATGKPGIESTHYTPGYLTPMIVAFTEILAG